MLDAFFRHHDPDLADIRARQGADETETFGHGAWGTAGIEALQYIGGGFTRNTECGDATASADRLLH